jgi:lactoylglutathione lyase
MNAGRSPDRRGVSRLAFRTVSSETDRMATRSFPVIYSRTVAEAEQFYLSFGFQETFRLPPEGEPGYVSLRRGESELGIVSAEYPRDQLGVTIGAEPRFELFIYVDDVDAEAERLRDVMLSQPRDMPWGERLAYVRDPDGNPIALAAATPTR